MAWSRIFSLIMDGQLEKSSLRLKAFSFSSHSVIYLSERALPVSLQKTFVYIEKVNFKKINPPYSFSQLWPQPSSGEALHTKHILSVLCWSQNSLLFLLTAVEHWLANSDFHSLSAFQLASLIRDLSLGKIQKDNWLINMESSTLRGNWGVVGSQCRPLSTFILFPPDHTSHCLAHDQNVSASGGLTHSGRKHTPGNLTIKSLCEKEHIQYGHWNGLTQEWITPVKTVA